MPYPQLEHFQNFNMFLDPHGAHILIIHRIANIEIILVNRNLYSCHCQSAAHCQKEIGAQIVASLPAFPTPPRVPPFIRLMDHLLRARALVWI